MENANVKITMAGFFTFPNISRPKPTRVVDGVTWTAGAKGAGEWFATVNGQDCEVSVSWHRGTRAGYSVCVGPKRDAKWSGERTFARACREAARLARLGG